MKHELAHVSATQITTFRRCPRKWWFNYVAGIRQPQTSAMAGGEAVHRQMENYYGTGAIPTNVSALALLDDLRVPIRGPGLLIEHPKDYNLDLRAAGLRVKGRIDLVDPGEGHVIHIWDWKTTSDLKWAKSSEDLVRDVQLNTYGQWAFSAFPKAERVRYFHGYVQTRDTAARVVETDELDRAHVLGVYDEIEATVRQMIEAAKLTDFEDVSDEGAYSGYQAGIRDSACNDFKGCPYLSYCSGRCRIGEPMANLRERLEARRKETNTTPVPASAVTSSTATGINPPDAAAPDKPQVEPQKGPFFMVYSPDATTPPKQRFSLRDEAEKVAQKMAYEHRREFYVVLTVAQVEPVEDAPVPTTRWSQWSL